MAKHYSEWTKRHWAKRYKLASSKVSVARSLAAREYLRYHLPNDTSGSQSTHRAHMTLRKWDKTYNRNMKTKKPPQKKKRMPKPVTVDLTKADPRDLGPISWVVETALRNRGATDQEIEDLIRKIGEVAKNKKKTSEAFGVSRKVFYRCPKNEVVWIADPLTKGKIEKV